MEYMKASSFVKLVLAAIFVLVVRVSYAQSGDADFDKAEQFYSEQNFKKAVPFYRKSADAGNVLAMYALANCSIARSLTVAVTVMWVSVSSLNLTSLPNTSITSLMQSFVIRNTARTVLPSNI